MHYYNAIVYQVFFSFRVCSLVNGFFIIYVYLLKLPLIGDFNVCVYSFCARLNSLHYTHIQKYVNPLQT